MRKQTFDVLKTCFEKVLLKKKLAEEIKMLSTGEKQQFKWTNKIVDDLISRFQNFKAFNRVSKQVLRWRQKNTINNITKRAL